MTSHPAPTHPLIRMRSSASIQEAAQLMCDVSMGALGVDDSNHEFVGLITERDLMWAVAQGKDPFETTVKDVVNDFPIVVDGPISIEDAARRMTTGHVRHHIVRIDGDARIVSMRDVLGNFISTSTSAASHPASTSEMRRMFGTAFQNGRQVGVRERREERNNVDHQGGCV